MSQSHDDHYSYLEAFHILKKVSDNTLDQGLFFDWMTSIGLGIVIKQNTQSNIPTNEVYFLKDEIDELTALDFKNWQSTQKGIAITQGETIPPNKPITKAVDVTAAPNSMKVIGHAGSVSVGVNITAKPNSMVITGYRGDVIGAYLIEKAKEMSLHLINLYRGLAYFESQNVFDAESIKTIRVLIAHECQGIGLNNHPKISADIIEVDARKQMDVHLTKIKDESIRENARKAANARHDKKGGARDKARQIQAIWATGKYTSRNICAEEECAALNMSYTTARRALIGTPDPKK